MEMESLELDLPSAASAGSAADEVSPESRYDVIICGTDLIQSILSSALSRAGKKVLHCDGNEWYGGLDAVLYGGSSLELFIKTFEQVADEFAKPTEFVDVTKDKNSACSLQLLPPEKYGSLRLHSQTFICEAKGYSGHISKEADDNTAKKHTEHAEKEGETNNSFVNSGIKMPCPLENGFCYDLNPSLLYASGEAVASLVKSGVADYLEFKSLKGLFLLMEEENSSLSRRGKRQQASKSKSSDITRGNAEFGETGGNKKLISYRVPCSKGDVFRSKLLSPVDKRRLMKFLQLVTDYGISTNNAQSGLEYSERDNAGDSDGRRAGPDTVAGEDSIQSINERHLHRGRSLSRPQNKATPSMSDMDALMNCISEGVSFFDFLTRVSNLPERLSTVVVYALALAPFANSRTGLTTEDGVENLLRHLNALGRFGDTAFLVPMYGNGELSQAFCRSGAVYGSTYMLRRSPLSISISKNGHVQSLVLSGEKHIGGINDVDTNDVSERSISCEHVIIPCTMMNETQGRKVRKMRTYRRTSIVRGKLMFEQDKNDTEQRHAIIIPPGTPDLENKFVIHGVAIDDSAFVAPHGKNYTMLHLTTSCQDDDDGPDEFFVDLLGRVVQFLIDNQAIKNENPPIEEQHHISFSYSTSEKGEIKPVPTTGLHVCYRDKQSFTCDSAFREAKRIFEEICPDSEFLALAKKVKDTIIYNDGNGSDAEKKALESACNMIKTP